jgi:hypothetical protein
MGRFLAASRDEQGQTAKLWPYFFQLSFGTAFTAGLSFMA